MSRSSSARTQTSYASRLRLEVLAVGAAVLTELGFAIGFALARSSALIPGYVALVVALTLLAGLACAIAGACVARSAGRYSGLTLYVLAKGLLSATWLWSTPAVAGAQALVTWLLLAREHGRIGLLGRGIAVGTALCASFTLWSFVAPMLGLVAVGPWQSAIHQMVVFAFVLATADCWETVLRQRLRLPPFAAAAAFALGIALVATAVAVERTRPEHEAIPHSATRADRAARPDFFVFVLDTVRADHLSAYGYARETTPHLDRFLATHPTAVRYEFAYSPASWTIPAHASLLTGLMPSRHGAQATSHEDIGYSATESIPIAAERTLAELLHEAGYCTSAVAANAYLLRVDGLSRGFEGFRRPQPTRRLRVIGEDLRIRLVPEAYAGQIKPYPIAEAVNRDLIDALRRCGDQPTFLLANYMDAHAPYLPPPPHAGRFAGSAAKRVALSDALMTDAKELVALKRDRYDEAIHYLDQQLGELVEQLDRDGALQGSWLFITADHGEAFREHETTSHGSSIYNEQVRIPLIVKPPSGVVLPPASGPVSLLDIPATIAAVVGSPNFGAGRDLRAPVPSDRAVEIEFSGSFRHDVERFGAGADDPARAIVRGSFKLLERSGQYELYDVASDPRELSPLGSDHEAVVRALVDALPDLGGATLDSPGASTPREPLGVEEREDLRALGYLR